MAERDRKEAAGKEYNRTVKRDWAIVTVQGILDNDFYIGTLRQGKYTRKKINGKDILRDEDEQIVIENHHQASSTTAPSPPPGRCGKSVPPPTTGE